MNFVEAANDSLSLSEKHGTQKSAYVYQSSCNRYEPVVKSVPSFRLQNQSKSESDRHRLSWLVYAACPAMHGDNIMLILY